MKKVVLIALMFILCGCEFDFTTDKIDAEDLIFNPEKEEKEAESKYLDENPVEISLYVDKPEGGLKRVENEYKSLWEVKKDIVVFGLLFSKEEQFAADYYQNIWASAAANYENSEEYKVGWMVEFTLEDGTEIKQVISKPSDVDYFYDYLEIYLYDSANAPTGQWYSHLLDSQMTEKTIMTSIKLTAGSKVASITSDIIVTGFTYDGADDFNEDGTYKGKSKNIVKVSRD